MNEGLQLLLEKRIDGWWVILMWPHMHREKGPFQSRKQAGLWRHRAKQAAAA